MKKIGRNEPCPCGSGKKYKKCHGDLFHLDRATQAVAAGSEMRKRWEAKETQRIQQQGLGRPIVATRTENGYQFVAVKNRLLHSRAWKTFHDFLIDYLKGVIGPDWGTAELRKPTEQRHPILIWYQKLCEQQKIFIKESGKVQSAAMTGAVAAYLHLAYDLYALDHNAEVQQKLVARLRNEGLFKGARYEVQVAAMLVRAGFVLSFENEDDRSTSHCEFAATHSQTGRKFSVEAKRAESGRVTRQLVRALNKAANHDRIVFIDLNAPCSAKDGEVPAYVRRAFDLLRRFEALDPQAQRLPRAYVFLTNAPWEHCLDDVPGPQLALADGFHIEDFKIDHAFPSLRAAIDSREAHVEMHGLLKSMHSHAEIPATFDGESPELAFAATEARLLVGNRYCVPDADGAEVEGVLLSAVVMKEEKAAACIVKTDDGRSILVHIPLSDAELAAWARHPDTFFGEVSRSHKAESVLDLYDFFLESYKGTPKEKLLEFLQGSPDIEHLAALTQPHLASVFSERLAEQAFASMGPGPAPLLQSRLQRPAARGR